LLVAEELTEGRSIDVVALKQIQDVGQITARLIRQDNMTFRASHSLFATTNYVPVISETDHGTWRRLALLRFPYTWKKAGEELVADGDRHGDEGLKERVKANESGQHDAMVSWAVEGARRWYEEGPKALALTETIKADTRAWRAEADRILGYWNDCLIADRDACVITGELREEFNDWLRANGHNEWSKELFGPRFLQHEETRRHGVDEARPRAITGRLWRPAYRESVSIGNRPVIYRGVRWRIATDRDETPGGQTGQTTSGSTEDTRIKRETQKGLTSLTTPADQEERAPAGCPTCGHYPDHASWCSERLKDPLYLYQCTGCRQTITLPRSAPRPDYCDECSGRFVGKGEVQADGQGQRSAPSGDTRIDYDCDGCGVSLVTYAVAPYYDGLIHADCPRDGYWRRKAA
jgi:hypothetical protein